jgi:hypothetical protein
MCRVAERAAQLIVWATARSRLVEVNREGQLPTVPQRTVCRHTSTRHHLGSPGDVDGKRVGPNKGLVAAR